MKNIKSGTNYLQRLYKLGIIDYPRVDNNYHPKSFYQLFPHPPLFEYGEEFTDIKEEEIPVKKAPLLFLNHLKILSPANILNFSKTIFYYLDSKLNLKKEKKEYEQTVEVYNTLKKKQPEFDFKIFGAKYKSLFDKTLKTKKTIYYIKTGEFLNLSMVINRLRKIASIARDTEYQNRIKFKEINSLYEAIEIERKKLKQDIIQRNKIKKGI